MSEFLYLLSMAVVFGTPLLIFGMKYISAAYQARARVSSDGAYQALAAKAAAAQSESAGLLTAMQADLSEIKARLASVEKILKAVE